MNNKNNYVGYFKGGLEFYEYFVELVQDADAFGLNINVFI